MKGLINSQNTKKYKRTKLESLNNFQFRLYFFLIENDFIISMISEFENFDKDWEMTVLLKSKAPGLAVMPRLKTKFVSYGR